MAASIDYLHTLDEERFTKIYEALSEKGFGPLDGEVAKAMKFRPQAIRKLPMAQRARKARSLLLSTNNAELAYEFLGGYLLKHRLSLVTRFLDATDVEHEEGMLATGAAPPAAEKVVGAVSELDAEHAPQDVTMYLALSAQTWPAQSHLDELWRARAADSTRAQ